jgi:glycosyltransferase involved in cell wall biosynthesis
VRLLRSNGSRGPAAARNTGVAAAQGEWIAFLDDDDLWSPQKLRIQLQAAREADWCYCAAVVVDDRLQVIDVLPLAPADSLAVALRRGNVVGGGPSAVVVRTDVLRQLGGFDEALYYLEDWDLWLRLAEAAPVASCGQRLVANLDHQDRALFRHPRAVIRGIDGFLLRIGADDDARRSAAEWVANEHHRGGRRLWASLLYLRAALLYRSPGNLPPAVGALFGEPGMRAAARLLSLAGKSSHLDLARHPPSSPPPWLEGFRDGRASVGPIR